MISASRAATALAVLLLASPPAGAEEGVLSVDLTATSLQATLDAIAEDTDNVTPDGTLTVQATLIQDPVEGLVVSSLRVVSGSLALGDGSLSLSFGTDISLTASSSSVSFDPSSDSIPGTVTGPNTSQFDVGGALLFFDGGSLAANGTMLGQGVNESLDLSTSPLTATLPEGMTATAFVQEGAAQNELTLSLPVDLLILALDDPLATPLQLTGTVVFNGPLTASIPSLRLPGLALLAVVLLAVAARITARQRTTTT